MKVIEPARRPRSNTMAYSESFDRIAFRLRNEFPGVELLAMGQTVYWDEPMKAILRRRLDERFPEAKMVIGIHDVDYFSRIPSTLNVPAGWAVVPHNDGGSRDLWVATGEISALFGSETIPTRELLASCGVQFDKIAKDFPDGRDALINTTTEAWGWRGLVHADSENEISCAVRLEDVLPHLTKLLEWGFNRSIERLVEPDASRTRSRADELIAEVRAYADAHPDASISDMFGDFLARFYTRLLGYQPTNLEVTAASRLFRFDKSTAGLPRFNPLRVFLDPRTAGACQKAYDLAVQGSDTYALDRFPPGAIPFDLVVPGRGRGTICLRDGGVALDLEEPISLPTDTPPSSPEELADLVERHLGREASLIGKALTLVFMIASEFIFVLNEQASAYVPRCEKMAALMKERGVSLPLYPILRIGYHTWDSLSACDATFRLPGHLGAAFGQGEITSKDFADSWRRTANKQGKLLDRISRLSAVADDLLAFLAEQQTELWPGRIQAYMEAYATIRRLSERAEPMKAESIRLRDLSHRIKQKVQRLEVEKGEHFRQAIKPLKDRIAYLDVQASAGTDVEALVEELRMRERTRSDLEREIERKREEAMAAHNRSLELKRAVRALEKGDEAQKARETLRLIEYEAELARLRLVRDAILVSRGLTYTNYRPSAWWFMLIDPELKWFNRVAETAEFRFEKIDPA